MIISRVDFRPCGFADGHLPQPATEELQQVQITFYVCPGSTEELKALVTRSIFINEPLSAYELAEWITRTAAAGAR